MKISFVKPNIGRQEHSLYVDEGRMEPLQLGVLAGLTPDDVECVLHDDRMEEIPYDDPTDLVAITVEAFTARRGYEIAAEFRKRGVPVVLGGFHPTMAPVEAQDHADSILIGDAETAWAGIVEDARKGKLEPVYRAPVGAAQVGGVKPWREAFAGKGYLPVTLMQFTRGCKFACEFCAISAYFDKGHFVRHTREVLDEIEAQERKFVFFVDDNFLADKQAAKIFLRELVPLKINWVSQATIDMTRDPELMALLVESGCLGNVIGFESINPESVKAMRKAPNLIGGRSHWDGYEAQCQILRDHGLQTWAAFTIGHEYDTVESIRETFDFAMQQKFCFAAYNILMPYPNTPLYARLEEEGRLLFDGQWWLHPEYRFNSAAFVPKNMTPDELTESCWDCRRRWNTLPNIARRLLDWKTHLSSLRRLSIYLQYTPLYAREAYKKQGLLFGLFRDTIQTRCLDPVRRWFGEHEVEKYQGKKPEASG